MQVRVTSNPYNLGNGHFDVGTVINVERETDQYLVLESCCWRVNKHKMALTGFAGRYAHSIELEYVITAPAPDLEGANTEILIETDRLQSVKAMAGDVGECLQRVAGESAMVVTPISEQVGRILARLPAGVSVQDALDSLEDLPFVLTAYPLGCQLMEPGTCAPSEMPRISAPPLPAPSVYQGGLHGEDYRFTRDEWSREVEADDTQLGYWDWVEHMIDANEDAGDLEVRHALAAGFVVVLVAREMADAATVAALGDWLNNGDREARFAVFPGDALEVVETNGLVEGGEGIALGLEVSGFLDEAAGNDLPRAVVSVGPVWNARPVPALSLAGVINLVARSYSGVSIELGENASFENGLVIKWDRTPGEPVEREIRAALTEALNKMAAALPMCCLSLSVPDHWRGRRVDRAALAAWCSRGDAGGDFSLALSAAPGVKLSIQWVAGPRPSSGLEAGILHDVNTWLNEGGTIGDDEPAEAPGRPLPSVLSLSIPNRWGSNRCTSEVRAAVAKWCEAQCTDDRALTLSQRVASGDPEVSWTSGMEPIPNLTFALEKAAAAYLEDYFNGGDVVGV